MPDTSPSLVLEKCVFLHHAEVDSVDTCMFRLLPLPQICNASAIQHVLPEEGSEVEGENDLTECVRQTTIATALYCSVSMMNHSCEPNVMSSFYKNKIIVRAIR